MLDRARDEVRQRTGIELVPEIEFIGDWGGRRDGPSEPAPVVVLLGGPSAEHDVSVVSGTAIAEALTAAGHPSTRS